ncbi:hypothetical protein F5Y19DRAFT_476100 [Xylariaceae sp. FL1651]|nr:hypothetical protein F5Y19DRAFT_476100 [Xylariaceae sp. FL1651]
MLQFFYISSFHITQREMLDSIMRGTGTTAKDWGMTTPSSINVRRERDELPAKEGSGGDYKDKAVDLRGLGHEEEDLDAITTVTVRHIE